MFIESYGYRDLFELPNGSIWYLTIHFDRHSKLEELHEFSAPEIDDDKPNGKYLWSSSAFKRGGNWLNFMLSFGNQRKLFR
jgi:hypothetical protein